MVLGVQWLYTLGEYSTNYQKLELKFKVNGEEVVLRGLRDNGDEDTCKILVVSFKRMEHMIRKKDVVWAAMIFQNEGKSVPKLHTQIDLILKKHKRVFEDLPKGLPPSRGFQHTIELKPNSKPVIIKPYRHPKLFKDEIEKAIKELLEMGNTRPSCSPFASPVVLVKKKKRW